MTVRQKLFCHICILIIVVLKFTQTVNASDPIALPPTYTPYILLTSRNFPDGITISHAGYSNSWFPDGILIVNTTDTPLYLVTLHPPAQQKYDIWEDKNVFTAIPAGKTPEYKFVNGMGYWYKSNGALWQTDKDNLILTPSSLKNLGVQVKSSPGTTTIQSILPPLPNRFSFTAYWDKTSVELSGWIYYLPSGGMKMFLLMFITICIVLFPVYTIVTIQTKRKK